MAEQPDKLTEEELAALVDEQQEQSGVTPSASSTPSGSQAADLVDQVLRARRVLNRPKARATNAPTPAIEPLEEEIVQIPVSSRPTETEEEQPSSQPSLKTRAENARAREPRGARVTRSLEGRDEDLPGTSTSPVKLKTGGPANRITNPTARGAGQGVKQGVKQGIKQTTKTATKTAAKQVTKRGLKLLAETVGQAFGIGEVVSALDIIGTIFGFLKKHWKIILAGMLAVIGGIVALIVMVISFGLGNPAVAGTSLGTAPIQTANPTQVTTLQSVLSGGVSTLEEAKKLQASISQLKTQTSDPTALGYIDKIDAATKAIIAAPADTKVLAEQGRAISNLAKQLQPLLNAPGCRQATACISMKKVGEGTQSLCGVTSVVMVILYYKPDYNDTRFFRQDQNYGGVTGRNGALITNPRKDYGCVSEAYMSQQIGGVPFVRQSWTKVSGGKDKIITEMKASLDARDPVVLFLLKGGIFSSSKHIVTVVGYDKNDSPEAGGTFIINNPNILSVNGETRLAVPGNGKKLTAEHIKQFLGGDGRENYSTSIIVRENHTK